MKKLQIIVILSLALALLCIRTSDASAKSAVYPNVRIQSTVLHDFSFNGKLVNGRTYVDAKGLLKCLPFSTRPDDAVWVAETKTLFVLGESYPGLKTERLKFANGSSAWKIGDHEVRQMSAKAVMIEGNLYVPLKDIADYYHLNLVVNKNRTVRISKTASKEKTVIANTVKLAKADVDRLIELTNAHIRYANDRDFNRYAETFYTKPKAFVEDQAMFMVWMDASANKLKLRRIDFVSADDVNGTKRVIADVKWTDREMQIAYLFKDKQWKIGSLD
ncbi:hypothetical protein D7Z26_02340 [Cohnella endophytica]|uniref:Copper amine oxidase N-terminal domain-containing protein n=1 Tax=Cohnella endophytica TaxID=2419778 RepID=A0A494Y2B5_9BACL|nr:hypothetical protein [Cohnella endophytica]RKP56849.1 hypothetical protein D7Z26_02340 [Cohnella endophytica]